MFQFDDRRYPFTGTFRSTPAEWLTALQAGKAFLDSTCPEDSTWCPVTINAWNEWSEGAYIEVRRQTQQAWCVVGVRVVCGRVNWGEGGGYALVSVPFIFCICGC
jgi:hypothetical protein